MTVGRMDLDGSVGQLVLLGLDWNIVTSVSVAVKFVQTFMVPGG